MANLPPPGLLRKQITLCDGVKPLRQIRGASDPGKRKCMAYVGSRPAADKSPIPEGILKSRGYVVISEDPAESGIGISAPAAACHVSHVRSQPILWV